MLCSCSRIFDSYESNASREDNECRLSHAPVVYEIDTNLKYFFWLEKFHCSLILWKILPILDYSCHPSESEGQQTRIHLSIYPQKCTEIE